MPQLMDMSVDEALDATVGLKKVQARLQTLHDLGLGYLTLGEPTPALSGGEAQRLKLASEMGRVQDDAVFVFDEPTIGLHPLDVQVLLSVFDGLVAKGATVIVIEHDLDLIRNADYVIDMGPGGGGARRANRLRRYARRHRGLLQEHYRLLPIDNEAKGQPLCLIDAYFTH